MAEVVRFARKTLGHTDTAERFVQVAINQRQALARGTVGFTHAHAPVVGQRDHER